MRSFAVGVLASCAVLACGHDDRRSLPALGQLLLYVDTDAPLPAPPGVTLGESDAPPLFDRLRIQLYRPGSGEVCVDCTHEFEVDRALVAAGRASIGITPDVGVSGYVARVRLYRAVAVEQGEPRRDVTIETFVALPPIAAEGITHVTVRLRTEDVAKVLGSREAPMNAELGPPSPGFTGSWAPARRRACNGPAREGEVCIPGGAYWMNHPQSRFLASEEEEPFNMRIAAVDPFFMFTREVTVHDFRASGLATAEDPFRFPDGNDSPASQFPCTYKDAASNFEDLPLTCVSWETARAYCERLEADLPTEAQFQYVAGGLQSRLFVWGNDLPSCSDAVFARSAVTMAPLTKCPGGWVERAGSGARDRLVRPDGVVLDVAGNAAEWMRDSWNRADEPCWGSGVHVNPLCESPTSIAGVPAGSRTVAGGHWLGTGWGTAAPARGASPPFSEQRRRRNTFALVSAATGFRCVRPGK